MPQRRHLPVGDMERIVGMILAGQTQRYVGRQFNVSQTLVGRVWQRYLDTGSVDERAGRGRPRKTTDRDDGYIVNLAKRRRFESAKTLNADFRDASGVHICEQTVRNRLHAANIRARRPAVRPPLTPEHRRLRLTFSQDQRNISLARLRSALFTDESKFCVDFNDGRRRVWRQKNERFRDCRIQEHDSFGGPSVLVWGEVSYDGSTDLYIIQNGALTGVRYRDEILDALVRPYAGAVGQDFVLMDDNARPHRARVVSAYLEREGIDRMNWPARSPDINPIEHVWDILQRRVSARLVPPQTRGDLTRALIEEWARIPRPAISKLIRSFKSRCRAVIDARVGQTRY